ncbi:MAG: carbon-nitrogen hydrolase family protein [Rhodospirillales bacterium]
MSRSFKAALVQMTAGREIEETLPGLEAQVREAKALGADLIALPENCTQIEPDKAKALRQAEPEERHLALARLRDLARELEAWLLVGSLSVKAAPRHCWNRSYLLAPDGSVAARYDKIHLFDVEVGDGQTYRESSFIAPGTTAVEAALPWGRLGLSVCYDLRFPHLYRLLAQAGAEILSIPAAFTKVTGEAHWHVLLRARAIETGCFVIAPAQCGTHAGGRQTYGHSLIVDPWGKVLADGGEEPGIVTATLDLAQVDEARRRIPALTHDRPIGMPGPTSHRLDKIAG